MNRKARFGIIAVSVAIFCYAGIGHVLGRTPDDKAYKSVSYTHLNPMRNGIPDSSE